MILSANRLDQLELLQRRWFGPMSVALLVNSEDSLEMIMDTISLPKFINSTFVLYILPRNNSLGSYFIRSSSPPFFTYSHFSEPFFPINLLRDLAIEQIDTTHYFLTDIDLLPTSWLYMIFRMVDTLLDNARMCSDFLSDPNHLLMIPSFNLNSKQLYKCSKDNSYKLWYIFEMSLK